MKRFTTIVALVLMVAMPMMAERVSPETAQKVATTFLNNNGAKAAQLTDLSKAAGFPNLYIFSTESSFVVMAAEDCVKPILGYSLTGAFVAEEMPENLTWWLKGYNDQIQDMVESQAKASPDASRQWKELASGEPSYKKEEPTVIASLIETRWDQGYPYNYGCSNGHGWITGCVATAMAQVMNFHKYPETGIGSHTYPWKALDLTADFGATAYDWSHMINSYSGSFSNEQRDAVATLIYHCGVAVEMKYSSSGSGSNVKRASYALQMFFNYNTLYLEKKDVNESEWINLLLEDLNNGKPILYGGNVPEGGHAFVCDGYDGNDLFHFNWGWSGNNDGYFAINDGNGFLSPSGQVAAFNISPMPCSALKPSLLEYTQTGSRNISLAWIAGDGSVSHNIYRNNTLIANTEESSYTDSNVEFGTNTYYVRSVDENGNLSLPSNCANIFIDYPIPTVNDLHLTSSEDNAHLLWSSPSWCFPETESETLAYVDRIRPEKDSFISWGEGDFCLFWGHRYLAENLIPLEGKALYKVSFYTLVSGSFQVLLFQGTDTETFYPLELVSSQPVITAGMGWIDVNLSNPLIIDSSQDLWVFINETEGKLHSIPCLNNTGISNSRYYSSDIPNQLLGNLDYDISWFIRTYLTDGTYTYNLYQDGTPIAQNLTETTYDASLNDDAANLFTVKTKFYGGETAASNAIGFAKGTASVANLEMAANDQMTITDGSKLTVNGTMSNSNAANLILENGAQLIHSSEGVKATVKKDIAAWTTETPVGGWYFIASPINSTELAPDNVDNMLTDGNETEGLRTYDLYRLENDNWKNYRNNAFNLANGKGYLYANESPQTLSFKGEIKPYDTENDTVRISSGWNLIGNPFTCNVVPNMAYHTLNNGTSTTSVNADEGLVTPGMGIAVYSENGGTLSFNLPTEGASVSSNGNLQMTLTQQVTNRNSTNAVTIDNAIVNFNESEALPKFNLLEANSKLYIPNGDKEYAIVSTEAKGEMPLNFKPSQDGTFTLTVQPESVKMGYLFLIDNMTGTHINLLTTPNYTFEAKTDDYESRFKLLFATANEETETFENESFGFIINGQFQSTIGQGLLQVIDLNGRILKSANETDCIGLDGLTAGVYVIRFITANSVRTQKIVVE